MTPFTLIPPADLSAIGFTVLLRIALGGLDGGTCVDEEKARHGEGGEWGGYRAGVEVEVAGFGRHYYVLREFAWSSSDIIAIAC